MSLLFVFIVPFQVFADFESSELILDSLFDQIIVIETIYDVDKSTVKYTNIDEFADIASEDFAISEGEISDYIISKIGLEAANLPENEKIKYIKTSEIALTSDYIKVDANGNMQYMTRNDMLAAIAAEDSVAIMRSINSDDLNVTEVTNNGYLQFDTIILRETEYDRNNSCGYQISAFAKWLRLPTCHYKDVLAIGYYGGVYDNNHEIYGKLEEKIYCCNSTYNYKSQVWHLTGQNDYHTNYNVIVEAGSGTCETIKFQLMKESIYTCNSTINNHARRIGSILSYMSYGILVSRGSNFQVQAGYAHKIFPGGDISVGVSAGVLSFSTSFTSADKYYAHPVSAYAS